jgi:hypothetical protein
VVVEFAVRRLALSGVTDNALFLALGAFLTSSGFAALAAVAAAFEAYRGITTRIQADRTIAREADDSERWWQMAMWLWTNRDHIMLVEASVMVDNLRRLVSTTGQAVMMKTLIAYFQERPEPPEGGAQT